MKKQELTELPKYWVIKVTKEVKEYISKLDDTGLYHGKDYNFIIDGYYTNITKTIIYGSYSIADYQTEISFNQFKKWVLKEEESKQYLSKTVVHCTTQEEWDYVEKKLNSHFSGNWFVSEIYGNNKSFCININETNSSQSLEHYKKENYTILSFSEWCNQFNHKPDFMKVEEKNLTVDDLVEGEVYYCKAWGHDYIFLSSGGLKTSKHIFKNNHYSVDGEFSNNQITKQLRKATPEEKQFLKACIKANKFIPKEEALKVEDEPRSF